MMNQPKPKTAREITLLRQGGDYLNSILERSFGILKTGGRLDQINHFIEEAIFETGGRPSFLGHRGYPWATCLSVNEVVVHGLPTSYRLQPGDILGLDVGLSYHGYHTDAALTVAFPPVKRIVLRLLAVTQRALRAGIAQAQAGTPLSAIGGAIEDCVQKAGKFGIVRELSGHGVGRALWEPPAVANYRPDSEASDLVLIPGLALAIEPMVTLGGEGIETAPDGWSIRTKDRTYAAHFEATVIVEEGGRAILTPFPLTSPLVIGPGGAKIS